MSGPTHQNVTQLLARVEQGDPAATDELMPLVYDELRRLAEHLLQHHRPDSGLQATALVHEAYLRLVGQTRTAWQGRAHFFALAATMIRRALVDHARARQAFKRGGGAQRLTIHDSVALVQGDNQLDLLSLHEALTEFSASFDRPSRVVELRFFAGLTIEETAEVLKVSPRTIKEDWRFARAWLRERLGDGEVG